MMYIFRPVYKFYMNIILSWLVLDGDTEENFPSKYLIYYLELYSHDECENFLLSRRCQAEIVT